MKYKGLFLINAALLFLVCACTPSHEYSEPTMIFKETKYIKSHELQLKNVEITNPKQILILDSLMVISDQFILNEDKYFFGVLNRNTGELYEYFGREGRGPNEFSDWTYIDRVSEYPYRIGINDRRGLTYHEISIPKVLTDSLNYTLQRYSDYAIAHSLITKINGQNFIGTGMFAEGRFALSDTTGELLSVLGEYPFEDELIASNNKRDLGMAFQSLIRMHPTNSLLAVVTLSSANLDILKLEEDSLYVAGRLHSWPSNFEGMSTENQWQVQFEKENKIGYRDLDTSVSRVYALYSGKKREIGWNNYRKGDTILVFDWEGNPVINYKLDREIIKFSIDKNDEIIYGIAFDENQNAVILTFDLKS